LILIYDWPDWNGRVCLGLYDNYNKKIEFHHPEINGKTEKIRWELKCRRVIEGDSSIKIFSIL